MSQIELGETIGPRKRTARKSKSTASGRQESNPLAPLAGSLNAELMNELREEMKRIRESETEASRSNDDRAA